MAQVCGTPLEQLKRLATDLHPLSAAIQRKIEGAFGQSIRHSLSRNEGVIDRVTAFSRHGRRVKSAGYSARTPRHERG